MLISIIAEITTTTTTTTTTTIIITAIANVKFYNNNK